MLFFLFLMPWFLSWGAWFSCSRPFSRFLNALFLFGEVLFLLSGALFSFSAIPFFAWSMPLIRGLRRYFSSCRAVFFSRMPLFSSSGRHPLTPPPKDLSRYVFWNRVSNLPLVPRYWALRVSTQNPFMRARDSQTARSVAQLAWAMHRTLFGPDSPSNPFPLATPAMQPAAGTRDIAGYSLASPVVAGPSSSSAAATATIPVPRPATSFAPAPASVGSSMMPGHRSPSPEQDVPSRDSILRRTQGGRISKAGSARPHGR